MVTPGELVALVLLPPVLVESDLVEVDLVSGGDPRGAIGGARFGATEADTVFTRLTVWLSATVRGALGGSLPC